MLEHFVTLIGTGNMVDQSDIQAVLSVQSIQCDNLCKAWFSASACSLMAVACACPMAWIACNVL